MTQLSGFLLTRHWRDTPLGIDISFWAWTPEGALRLHFPRQQAVCFIGRDRQLPAGISCERKQLALADLEGNPIDGLYFHRQGQLQRLRELASGSD